MRCILFLGEKSMINILGILLGLVVLILLVFRKVNLILSVMIAVIICGLSNGLSVWETYSAFSAGMGSYLGGILFVFVFASIYGQVLTDSGCAASIAYRCIDLFKTSKYVVLVIPLITAILVYGGVSVFVVVFTMMPIGVMLLRESDLNKSLLPGLINFGATTFAMTCLPGTPQLNNIIPSKILGTPPTAAPVLGIIGTLCFISMGICYFRFQINKYRKQGRVFDTATVRQDQMVIISREECPPLWKALASIVTLMAVYLSLAGGWFGYRLPTYDAVNTGMVCATLLLFFLNHDRFSTLVQALVKGSTAWIMPLINLCAVIGLGAVIKTTPGFASIVSTALSIPGNVYISAATSTTLVAGITGSASGGIQLALESLAGSWLEKGANPEVLHRICAVASGGLDSLPHAGGLFTVFAVCNETHRSGYPHLFWSTVVIPIFVTIILIGLAGFGIV